MIALTFAPLGWTWLHNNEEHHWELGFYQEDLPRGNPWHCYSWISDEFIEYVHPEVFPIVLENFARFAVECDALDN